MYGKKIVLEKEIIYIEARTATCKIYETSTHVLNHHTKHLGIEHDNSLIDN